MPCEQESNLAQRSIADGGIGLDKEYLGHLTALLTAHAHPERIYLFGSWARGDETEDSDIDLLIIKNTDLPRYKRARGMRRLIRPYKYPLDLIVYTPEEFERERDVVGTIPYQVVREGVLLHG